MSLSVDPLSAQPHWRSDCHLDPQIHLNGSIILSNPAPMSWPRSSATKDAIPASTSALSPSRRTFFSRQNLCGDVIEDLWEMALHTKGQFVGFDDAVDTGMLDVAAELFVVEPLNVVELHAL